MYQHPQNRNQRGYKPEQPPHQFRGSQVNSNQYQPQPISFQANRPTYKQTRNTPQASHSIETNKHHVKSHHVSQLNNDLRVLKQELKKLTNFQNKNQVPINRNRQKQALNRTEGMRTNLSAENLRFRKDQRPIYQPLIQNQRPIPNLNNKSDRVGTQTNKSQYVSQLSPLNQYNQLQSHHLKQKVDMKSFNELVEERSINNPSKLEMYSKIDGQDRFNQRNNPEKKIVPIPIVNPNKKPVEIKDLQEPHHFYSEQLKIKQNLQIKKLKIKMTSLENTLTNTKNDNYKLNRDLSKLQKENQRLSIMNLEEKQKKRNEKQQESKQAQNFKSVVHLLQNQINSLKNEKKIFSSNNFNEVLKNQIEQTDELKSKLEQKQEQVQKLKQQLYQAHKRQLELTNDLKVKELQCNSLLRNKQLKSENQLLDKNNEIQTYRRSLETLDNKYKIVVKEVSDKDQFILNFLVSRSKDLNDQSEIKSLLSSYLTTFPENRTFQSIYQEVKQIQKLKKELQEVKLKRGLYH